MQRVERRAVLAAPLHDVLITRFGILFPSDCRLCKTPLLNASRLPVCQECLAVIHRNRAALCVICGERLAPARLPMAGGLPVTACMQALELIRAVSYREYEGGLLVHFLKSERVLPAAPPPAEMLADAIAELLPALVASLSIIVPVALHLGKRSERGLQPDGANRARGGAANGPTVRNRHTSPVRRSAMHSQAGFTREQRIKNMSGGFRLVPTAPIAGRRVMTVDDVMAAARRFPSVPAC